MWCRRKRMRMRVGEGYLSYYFCPLMVATLDTAHKIKNVPVKIYNKISNMIFVLFLIFCLCLKEQRFTSLFSPRSQTDQSHCNQRRPHERAGKFPWIFKWKTLAHIFWFFKHIYMNKFYVWICNEEKTISLLCLRHFRHLLPSAEVDLNIGFDILKVQI